MRSWYFSACMHVMTPCRAIAAGPGPLLETVLTVAFCVLAATRHAKATHIPI